MFGLGTGEVIVIFVVAFILFGPQKLPDVARGLGKAIRRFKEESGAITGDVKKNAAEEIAKAEEMKNNVQQHP